MTAETRPERAPGGEREIVLQGTGLVLAAAVVAAALLAAFAVGRWYEARSRPSLTGESGAGDAGSAAPTRSPTADVRTSRFEEVGEPGALEPRREARGTSSGAAPSGGRPAVPVRSDGPFFVQVFAGRSREAAERVVAQLGDGGHAARMESAADGRDTLFRVQVGGFPTRASAERAVETLRREGFRGAFVARAP